MRCTVSPAQQQMSGKLERDGQEVSAGVLTDLQVLWDSLDPES